MPYIYNEYGERGPYVPKKVAKKYNAGVEKALKEGDYESREDKSLERFGAIKEADQRKYTSDFLQGMATLGAQQQNIVADRMGGEQFTDESRAAAARGVAMQAGDIQQKGVAELERYFSETERQARLARTQYKLTKQIQEQQSREQLLSNLAGIGGAILGNYLGGPVGGAILGGIAKTATQPAPQQMVNQPQQLPTFNAAQYLGQFGQVYPAY